MKSLQTKTNVEPVSVEYPYGDLKNNTGTNNGTPVNRDLLADSMQFFEKLMAESGIAPNGFPDNVTNGFQLFDALRKIFKPYKTYNAKIDQSGVSAPTVTVKGFNDLGNIVWTRTGIGVYRGTLTGAFSNSSTAFIYNTYIGIGTANDIEVQVTVSSVNYIEIKTFNNDTPTDAALTNFDFEMKVYD